MAYSSKSLYAPASYEVIPSATVTMTDEDSSYPAVNAQNDEVEDTAKATGQTTIFTCNFAPTLIAVEPVAAAVINTNATEINISNDAGLDEDIAVPSRTLDGKQRNGWIDLRGLLNRLDSKFYFTLSKDGTAQLEVGRLVLVLSLLEFVWSPGVEFGHTRYGSVRNRTRLGSVRRRLSPVAPPRTGIGQFEDLADLTALLDLEAMGNGLGRGFLVIPDQTKNDALFVQPAEDAMRWIDQGGAMALRLPIEEIPMGLPPDRA